MSQIHQYLQTQTFPRFSAQSSHTKQTKALNSTPMLSSAADVSSSEVPTASNALTQQFLQQSWVG